MTAIAIILVLVSLLYLTIGQLSARARKDSTRTAFHSLAGMQAAWDCSGTNRALWNPDALNWDGATKWGAVARSPGMVNSPNPDRTGQEIAHTRDVLAQLYRIPENAAALGRLPRRTLFTFTASSPAATNQGTPVFLDGWGNPILYVPAEGLAGVTVRSTGVTYTDAAPLRSRDGRPFFASAGPDEDFSTGDDNLYSFEN